MKKQINPMLGLIVNSRLSSQSSIIFPKYSVVFLIMFIICTTALVVFGGAYEVENTSVMVSIITISVSVVFSITNLIHTSAMTPNWTTYIFSLPVSKETFVSSSYFFLIINFAEHFILTILIYLGFNILSSSNKLSLLFMTVLLISLYILCLFNQMFKFILKAKSCTIVQIALMSGGLIAVAITSTCIEIFNITINSSKLVITLILSIILAVVLTILCYIVSLKKLKYVE